MIRHPRRSAPAAIVALVLLAISVLVAAVVVQSLLGQTPLISLSQLLAVSSAQRWSSPLTITVAIVLAVLGLILLYLALSPGKPTVLPLARHVGPDGAPVADAGVRRHTLAKDLIAVAAGAPGVTHASVKARRRTVTAKVTTAAADPAAVPADVRERLEARLGEIVPARTPKVRVRSRPDENT